MQKMPSSSPIIVFLFLLQVAQTQGDCTRASLSGSIVLSAESVKDSYADGEAAKVKCAVGYVPVDPAASRSITCSGTQWTKPLLECKKKTCGSPGEIMNGRYLMPDGIEFGATITAECNPGYGVIGVNRRHCLENGWSGRPLECDHISKCLKPASIKDGRFEPVEESYDFGSVVSYSCVSKDFTLIGSDEITCYENGTFYPDPPQCLVVSCPEPDVPHADKVGGKMRGPYSYKHFIRYRCDDGYRMSGTDTTVCEVNGWNPPPPRCDVTTTTTTTSTSTSVSPMLPPQSQSLKKALIGVLVSIGIIVHDIYKLAKRVVAGVIYYRKKKAAQRSFAKVENKTDEPVPSTGQEL